MRRVSYKFRDVQREGFLHTWIRDADGDPCGIVEDKVTGGIRPILCTNITMLPSGDQPQNIVQIGNVMFTTYVLPFQLAGLVLLTAMVGAIVLTHRPRAGVRRQNITKQVLRTKEEGLTLTKPKTGQGLGSQTAKHWKPKSVAK